MKKIIIIVPLLILAVLMGSGSRQPEMLRGTVVCASQLKPLKGVLISVKSEGEASVTDKDGHYAIRRPSPGATIEFRLGGYRTQLVKYEGQQSLDIELNKGFERFEANGAGYLQKSANVLHAPMGNVMRHRPLPSESYASFAENRFVSPQLNPLSTFGIDVDAASYSNVRRFINQGQLPPSAAVRIEEMINYFEYDYPAPENDEPLSISTELSTAPWNAEHKLLRIGLQAKKMDIFKIPPSNLVLLVDVSGSMNAYNKLPLVKSSLKMLVNQLRPSDNVSIVSYAGSADIALEPTSGKNKRIILDAINRLQAGGSTAGGAGIKLAYDLAASRFIKKGNNRVIMATDGDFNTGQSSDMDMQKLIEEKRKTGIFLSVLGFGMGNYKDSKMELLADKGNGNYAYIDNISEGRKVLVTEFGGTLFTLAKDVKLQLEFNPSRVQAYRLIGYENRSLNAEDFNNDLKDAGDVGAGHSVTALYEIIPHGVKSRFVGSVDELKYQRDIPAGSDHADELVSVSLRYKAPNSNTSRLLKKTVGNEGVPLHNSSNDFRFSAAVAGYGMLLKKSEFVERYTFEMVADLANKAMSKDDDGFKSEFVRLVRASSLLAEELLTLTEN
ncbi:von Willebrand factor type A domain-containing protein [Arcticibacter sp.]|uniref:YfbK domain-containing protein n=1 Tax=Arcticibacter sp. TaxID=1872630 RepID=UPI00388F7263